ncbi:hypothetical protein [Bradyrhizobium elkanii]|uniref:hypothetical protein n=1 Tax=Bradyrhizobium elkanii TaxID=29448 RepID=UPI002226F6F0|nr:hypothetical protein [Bradyrhizobium elkanii]MCW2110479.1 hypothetical protein [Bradyrhizobium elkanii]WLB68253.1 hypothetical protein QIH89_23120 [Bradyrhizobium elkanii]
MADEAVFEIKGEDDAWKLLESALQNKLGELPAVHVVWNNWPTLNIHLSAVPEDGTISSSTMEAILELQRSLYRTHALLSTGSDSLRTLSRSEREQFELRLKVEKGSSDLSINLSDIISKYGNDVIAKMTGSELLILVLGLALIYAGRLVIGEFIKAKTEQRKNASDDEKTKLLLSNYQAQVENDTKRFELLTQALHREPVLQQVEQTASQAREEIVKAVADEGGGSIQHIPLPREVAVEISSVSRAQSSEVKLAGQYRVAKVDTTVAEGFRVTLEDTKTGEAVTASLFDAIISAEHRRALQDAEWNKKPVFVEMTAKRLRGRITEAKILGVASDEAGVAG